MLKENLSIWKNGLLACYYAAIIMEIQPGKYNSIVACITAVNKANNNVKNRKSSNLTSYQQCFANKYRDDRGIKHDSKRKPIDMNTLLTAKEWAALIPIAVELRCKQ